ncbi:MAG: hypothetical protein Q4B81_00145 [Moraxella sp.]|nr:hypothetical protein [Moraxella sp.]
MLQRAELETVITGALSDYPDVAERYRAGDPTVSAMLGAITNLVMLLSHDTQANITEPFIKSKDKTIIADAISKGILPVATPCQHRLVVENTGTRTVSLSSGRTIEDSVGRAWRLMSAVSVPAGQSKTVLCEQSHIMEHRHTCQVSESFYWLNLPLADDMHLAAINITKPATKTTYRYTPKFMNAKVGEAAYTLVSEDLSSISVIFGDGERCGQTMQAGDELMIKLTHSYGYIDINSLKQASLDTINNGDERHLLLYFERGGLVRAGADPLSISQMRLLASFPSTYDQNAVFMGNFDMLIRQHLMGRIAFMSVWNESVHERYYGASVDNINHLNLAIVAKTSGDQQALENDAKQLIARADSLLDGRVRLKSAADKPYAVEIEGQLAGVHDMDGVKTQIKELLLAKYGKGTIAASYPNLDGFNRQEIAMLIRENVPAFQDRISDFSVKRLQAEAIRPHEWVYLTESSISVTLTRTAEVSANIWTI